MTAPTMYWVFLRLQPWKKFSDIKKKHEIQIHQMYYELEKKYHN